MSQQPTPSTFPSSQSTSIRRQRFVNALRMWLPRLLIMFFKSLPLLGLWLVAGLIIWWILFLLGWVSVDDKETLLTALIPAFVGFAVQQWSLLTEEEETRRTQLKEAQGEIEKLPALLKDDTSESAHRYLEYIQSDEWVWKDAQIRDRLQRVWQENAPEELQCTVELRLAFEGDPRRWTEALERIGKRIGMQKTIKSLEWAYKTLDEDWQGRVADLLNDLGMRSEYREVLDGEVFQEIEQKSWRAILQPWPHVRPWEPFRSPDPPDVATGVQLLGLEGNPFGSGSAESDTLLFKCRVNLSILKELRTPKPLLLFGKPGSGKTALALFLAYDSVHAKDAFPIYYPDIPSEPTQSTQRAGLARTVTHVLLHFLAIHPETFTKQGVAGRAAVAHLLGLCVGTGGNLALRLQQAGLSPFGTGNQMLKELERLMQNVLFDTLPDENEIITLLGAARPRGFPCTFILLDLDDPEDDTTTTAMAARLQPLLDWTIPLARVGVYLKAFLSETLKPHLRIEPLQPILLEWHTQDLHLLLTNRVSQAGVDSVGVWCDPDARMLSPDERLVKAAQGMPSRLIQLGNQLLARVATHPEKPVITAKDLDDVLGPLPE